MKVITYNLHKGQRRRNRSILEDAVHALREHEPDLLLCQEVFHGVADALHQCHFITEVIGHDHAFGPNAFYDRGCHGNATFARMRVAHSTNIDATQSRLEKRGILRTWLTGDHGAFEVLNVHLSLTARQRHQQWIRVLEALPEDPRIPFLVGGDFNDWGGGLDRSIRRHGQLRNALWSLPRRARASFPARFPVLALDRVYYHGFRVLGARVLGGDPWARLSDHLPVEVELEPDGDTDA